MQHWCRFCRQFVVLALLTLVTTIDWSGLSTCRAQETEAVPYPFGLELQVLARDLTSKEYHAVLETMIPTDLAAEWLRIGTADNAQTFLAAHGGREAVLADPALKSAYDERQRIVAEFLALMTAACKKRDIKPPFDDAKVQELLASAGKNPQGGTESLSVPVRVIMPAADLAIQRKVPIRLIWMTLLKASSGWKEISPVSFLRLAVLTPMAVPAQLTRMRSCPLAARAAAKPASTEASSVTLTLQ